jgi:hypothetical protein
LDRLEHTALDYINERLPEIIPPGDLPEQIKFVLATWNMLVDHGAMTKDELRLRETPAIKRKLGMNNNANNLAEAAAIVAGAPSPQAVRHAFLRDWAQQIFGRAREFGGRRVRARRVSRSRRHRRKTQRKSKNR